MDTFNFKYLAIALIFLSISCWGASVRSQSHSISENYQQKSDCKDEGVVECPPKSSSDTKSP